MPNDLKSIIMHASVKVNRDDYNHSENYIIDSYEDIDKERSCMFIPSLKELNTSSSYSVDYDSYCDEFGEQFPIFTSNTSRIKNTYNVMYGDYWTRSVSKNLGGVYIIDINGESDLDIVYSNNGIIFFFCI